MVSISYVNLYKTKSLGISPEPVSQIMNWKVSHSHSSAVIKSTLCVTWGCGFESHLERAIFHFIKIWLVQEQLFTVENGCCCLISISYINIYKTKCKNLIWEYRFSDQISDIRNSAHFLKINSWYQKIGFLISEICTQVFSDIRKWFSENEKNIFDIRKGIFNIRKSRCTINFPLSDIDFFLYQKMISWY